MTEAVIVSAVRTAHGKRGGSLASVHPVDLLADVLSAAIGRIGIGPEHVDDVAAGCVGQIGDQSSNVARFAVLAAGWPEEIPGVTINRACGSSQQALDYAAWAIMAGQADVVIAAGVESMSRVPLGAARETGQPYGPRVLERYGSFSFNQGISAEMVAARWGFTRRQLDEYALASHAKARAAADSGAFAGQIVPVEVGAGTFAADEGVRRDTSLEKLGALRPSFQADGVIHPGNSSQISDGASAVVVMSAERARDLSVAPLVRYRAGAVTGADPVLMLTGPIPATQRLLKRAGVPLADIGTFEVNEACAPVPLAWIQDLGADPDRVNPLGGAIALGHPLGASGTSLMTRMVHHMRDHDIRYGLQTMCEGGGTANATLVELVA
jgi:acetyl-CoA acyltransferase